MKRIAYERECTRVSFLFAKSLNDTFIDKQLMMLGKRLEARMNHLAVTV
jgi:hypothetical protein